MPSRTSSILLSLYAVALASCSPEVPSGSVAEIHSRTSPNQIVLQLLPDKQSIARSGDFKFSAMLGSVARSAVAKKKIVCQRAIWGGQIKRIGLSGDAVPINPTTTLQYRLIGDVLEARPGISSAALHCSPVTSGEVVIVSVLFFYEPSSVLADADELSLLEIPIIVPTF